VRSEKPETVAISEKRRRNWIHRTAGGPTIKVERWGGA